MKLTVFLKLQQKRILKNIPFLLLLLLFPLCLFLLSRSFNKAEDSRIAVGLCLATDDSLAQTTCEKLVNGTDSLFTFSMVTSENDLIKKIRSNQLECGYFFHKNLGEELDRSHLKNLITVYVSENTTCTGILNELVYANLFEEYSLSLLLESLTAAGHLPFTAQEAEDFLLPPVTEEDVEKYYRSHLTDNSTFRFDIRFVSGTDTLSSDQTGIVSATTPLFRGLASLFLLLCGFLALLTVYQDEKNGLYAKLYGVKRILYPRFAQLTYLLPAGISCLLGLALSGSVTHWGKEIVALLCYLAVLLLFYTILGTLIRNHTVLCAAFPMVLLCTLVFTPVIADLTAFFPWLKAIRYALPTYYYLLFF